MENTETQAPVKVEEKKIDATMIFFLEGGRELRNTLSVCESEINGIREGLISRMENGVANSHLVMQGTNNNKNDFCILPQKSIVGIQFQITQYPCRVERPNVWHHQRKTSRGI